MFNRFSIARYAGIMIAVFIPFITFQIAALTLDYIYGIAGFILVAFLTIPLAGMLSNNPYTKMAEGKGIIVHNIDSTGIMKPFIVSVGGNKVFGKLGKGWVEDIFDRETVHQLVPPIQAACKAKKVTIDNKNYFIWALTEKEYNGARHQLETRPALIWNNQTESLITKDWWSEQEKDLFSEHVLLRIDRRAAELGVTLKNFGRYVVNSALKPQVPIFQKWWFWLLIIGGLVILAFTVGPLVMQAFRGGAVGGLTETITDVVSPR